MLGRNRQAAPDPLGMPGTSGRRLVNVAGNGPSTRMQRGCPPGQLQSRARGSLRLILARESPALGLVHVHFTKAGFELIEP